MEREELKNKIKTSALNFSLYNEQLLDVLNKMKVVMDNLKNITDEYNDNNELNKIFDEIYNEIKDSGEDKQIQITADKISEILKELNLY